MFNKNNNSCLEYLIAFLLVGIQSLWMLPRVWPIRVGGLPPLPNILASLYQTVLLLAMVGMISVCLLQLVLAWLWVMQATT